MSKFSSLKLAKDRDPIELLMELEDISAQVNSAEFHDSIHLRSLAALLHE